jgi:ankyrin repeat protein
MVEGQLNCAFRVDISDGAEKQRIDVIMKTRRSPIGRLRRLASIHCGLVILGALAWSRAAYCDPIHDAAQAGDLGKIQALIAQSAGSISSKDDFEDTPLHYAAAYNRPETVKWLLAHGADVNAKDSNGDTPLDSAAGEGSDDAAALLLAAGAGVNAGNNEGWRPLHFAAVGDHKAMVELLLEKGAKVNAKADCGDTPLHDAAGGGNTDIVTVLLAHNADVTARDGQGRTPLHSGAGESNNDVPELQLDKEADFAGKRNPGWMHSGASKNYAPLVALLIEAKADVNAHDNVGRTPLDDAELHGHNATILLLKQHGAVE